MPKTLCCISAAYENNNLSEGAVGGRSLGHCELFFILQRDGMLTKKMLWGEKKCKNKPKNLQKMPQKQQKTQTKRDRGRIKSIILILGINNSISYFTSYEKL